MNVPQELSTGNNADPCQTFVRTSHPEPGRCPAVTKEWWGSIIWSSFWLPPVPYHTRTYVDGGRSLDATPECNLLFAVNVIDDSHVFDIFQLCPRFQLCGCSVIYRNCESVSLVFGLLHRKLSCDSFFLISCPSLGPALANKDIILGGCHLTGAPKQHFQRI